MVIVPGGMQVMIMGLFKNDGRYGFWYQHE